MGSELWQKLRLVIVQSTEVEIPIDAKRSPFNIGLDLDLPPFRAGQVESLARCYELYLSADKIEQLMELVAGHPYLVQLAFYCLAQEKLTWEELMQNAATDGGIYHKHLQRLFGNLNAHPDLAAAYQQVVQASQPVKLERHLAFKLRGMGLANLQENAVTPSCQLYRQYFLN